MQLPIIRKRFTALLFSRSRLRQRAAPGRLNPFYMEDHLENLPI